MKVINGNNIDILKQYPDNYFDAIVTDPPYGLGKEPNAEELMRDWIEKGYHEVKGSGFMGKEWDAFVPQPIFWKEVFRVLKHGGHVLSFFGTRTYDWGVMAMRFAGFEVRDCIQWLYGSGFPKSHNISKAIDKMYDAEREIGELKFKGGTQLGVINDDNWKPKDVYETYSTTEQAKQWDGWGSALKPANEPIVLARKPLEKGLSIAENVLKWGTGAINIDGCRVNISSDDPNHRHNPSTGNNGENSIFGVGGHNGNLINQGRFPANLILTHHPECECVGTKKVKAIKGGIGGSESMKEQGYGFRKIQNGGNAGGLGDENGKETIEDWNCHPDCPIKILDEQSGESKNFGDKGGASRFFYVAKASKSERNKGLDNFEENQSVGGGGIDDYLDDVNSASGKYGSEKAPNKNFHPTVKPIKLMQYLVRLITPTNGIVLDPFCGSGTTGIACKLEGFDFVGLEQDAEYTKIAQARIDNYVDDKKNDSTDTETNDNQLSLF